MWSYLASRDVQLSLIRFDGKQCLDPDFHNGIILIWFFPHFNGGYRTFGVINANLTILLLACGVFSLSPHLVPHPNIIYCFPTHNLPIHRPHSKALPYLFFNNSHIPTLLSIQVLNRCSSSFSFISQFSFPSRIAYLRSLYPCFIAIPASLFSPLYILHLHLSLVPPTISLLPSPRYFLFTSHLPAIFTNIPHLRSSHPLQLPPSPLPHPDRWVVLAIQSIYTESSAKHQGLSLSPRHSVRHLEWVPPEGSIRRWIRCLCTECYIISSLSESPFVFVLLLLAFTWPLSFTCCRECCDESFSVWRLTEAVVSSLFLVRSVKQSYHNNLMRFFIIFIGEKMCVTLRFLRLP